MNKYTKMRLMTSRSRQDGRDGDRRGYDRPDMRDGYSGPESRFWDRDGREHYNDGRYAPMSWGGAYGGDPMDRGGYGSPYDQALKKNNASTLELYACLAKAWIEDQDAVPDKLAAYYTYVVKH